MKSKAQSFQIFVRFPDLRIPTRAFNFPEYKPNLSLHDLKASLFRENSACRNSIFFTINGRPISDSAPIIRNSQIAHLSTITAHVRIVGGGGDGGATGAESRDCYLKMYAVKKPDKVDPNETRLSKWVNCSFSNEPLRRPVVIDRLGNLFNKEALVEGLLAKTLPKEYGYIKGLKDMITVKLADIPGVRNDKAVKFQCPITGLECNGNYKFFAIKTCGHVLSAKGLKEVKSRACLICHKEFTEIDKIVINGSEEEVKALWDKMVEEKNKDSGKKSKKLRKGTAEKVAQVAEHEKKRRIEENNGANESSKKFKATDIIPANATKTVYESIFTSSKKSDFKETYSCRSLPLGRN